MRKCAQRHTIMLVAAIALWIYTGEVAIHYLYSFKWSWPQLGLSKESLEDFTQVDPPRNPFSTPDFAHYQRGDSHYYVMPASSEQDETDGLAVRVLFMSDPHIMCTFQSEFWLAREDADHYLRRAYSHLVSTLHPDVVVLLGDLFSDGFQASPTHWKDYLQCLENIFPRIPQVKLLVAYGDNDIGGEGRDYMTEAVKKRYVETFGPLNSNHNISGVQFFKLATSCFINDIPRTHTETSCREDLILYISKQRRRTAQVGTHHALRVALSHVPLHQTPSNRYRFLREKVLQLHPHYIFSGHIHHQKYSTHSWECNEITVPTCSYRMGEQYMGVGVAVIGSDGNMAYRVLWLPPRYPFLISYVVLAVVAVAVLCCSCMQTRLRL